MGKKVLIISTSLRKNGNSDMLAQSFAKGAEAAGNDVEIVSLADKQIAFCRGCFACQKTGKCIINDDAVQITEKIAEAEVVVWATPIYYYEMTGQMKTMIDRANALFVKDYKFRDIYMLSAATEEDASACERAITGLKGWIACFPESRFAGSVFAGGVTDKGDISGHKALDEAYDLGRNA
jgi:multimeric flavodoxin WrbA